MCVQQIASAFAEIIEDYQNLIAGLSALCAGILAYRASKRGNEIEQSRIERQQRAFLRILKTQLKTIEHRVVQLQEEVKEEIERDEEGEKLTVHTLHLERMALPRVIEDPWEITVELSEDALDALEGVRDSMEFLNDSMDKLDREIRERPNLRDASQPTEVETEIEQDLRRTEDLAGELCKAMKRAIGEVDKTLNDRI